MQPPIPTGTLLQNRYKLLKVLGQGGFGRTYLAEDQRRFHEQCVVKEYIPMQQGGDYALQKSKELFNREATILYQIEHPQIPKFREAFEQGRRLFFVQDFVEGKTYSSLLQERLEQGQTFVEREVLHLMQQMLPVLGYIHSKGIIHRDISPDNIILRASDRLPVLIDFGVVKAIEGELQASERTQQGTTVGKLGYSPSEQLQTGKVYPNSDLYALAVTVVVLLTGKQPQDLLDENTMTWHWQQRVPGLNPMLVQILSRMMNSRPNNRYQSATEVLMALRSLTGLVDAPADPITSQLLPPKPATTMARSTPKTTAPAAQSRPTTQVESSDSQSSRWISWGIFALVGLSIAIAPWVLINILLQNQVKKPSNSASPPVVQSAPPIADPTSPVTGSPTPNSPTPPPGPEVPTGPQTVTFSPNQETIEVRGTATLQQSPQFLVTAQDGQTLSFSLLQGNPTIEVKDPVGIVLPTGGGATWQSAPLLRSGTYTLTVTALQPTEFHLQIGLRGQPAALPSPSPAPPIAPPAASPTVPTPPAPLAPSPIVPPPSP